MVFYSSRRLAFLALAAGLVVSACSQHSAVTPILTDTTPRGHQLSVGSCDSAIGANFNGTPIATGNTIWFSAGMKVQGLSTSSKTTINLTSSTITFTANGTPYNVAVPNSAITFDPAATTASLSYDAGSNQWNETLPLGLGGNFLLGAVELPVTTNLPGGIQNVTWAGHFTNSPTNITVNWQWAAAVYSQFSTDYNVLGVKPVDNNQASQYKNSDHAGTPENFKANVTGGARGGGGSNYTGGLSGTLAVTPCAAPGWTTLAPMPTARSGAAAGVIDGKLYVLGGGGIGGEPTLATNEAYDPSTNQWTEKAPMPTARFHLGVGVINGILYAVGGANTIELNTLEAYNPVTDTWSTKAPMPTARLEFGSGVVNGILYVVAGNPGDLNTLEAYDPTTDTWTTKAPLPTGRYNLAAGVVNGVLYAFGGFNDSLGLLNTLEAYDPTTDTWTTKAPMPAGNGDMAAGAVNGILYEVGGAGNGILNTVEAYEPTTDTWTTTIPMPTARYDLAVADANGTLYAVGGYNGNFLSTLEAFTP